MSTEFNSISEDSLEVVQPGALEAIARADINQQIATAKQFPRSTDIRKIQGRMIQMACYSPEAAAEGFYCIPRGGLDIYGPSVRLSEIVAYCWGNLYSVSRLVDVNQVTRLVTAQAIAWDLEANYKEGLEYTNRITVKGPEGAKTASLAAIAMAGRNAKFKVVPRIVWWPVYERCLAVARGDVVPLGDRIAKMIKSFAVYGITLDRILAKFSYENVTQFQENDLPALIGYHTAIKEEASTPEEIFPRIDIGRTASQEKSDQGNKQTYSEPIQDGSVGGDLAGRSTPEPPPARRRGRPPGSGRKPESVRTTPNPDPDQNLGHLGHESPGQETQYGPAADLPGIAQFPAQETTTPEPEQATPEGPQDPKKELATEVRRLLEQSKKSEAALMAKLREWGFGKNLPQPPIRLEDHSENDLQQVIARWGNFSNYVR